MTKKSSRVKRVFQIIMPLVGLASFIIFPPWIIVQAWIMPLPDTVQEQVNEAVEYDLDGMIVYVDKAGEEEEFYSAGWKNRENKIPADPQAYFKIASISKLYIAAAVAKMANAGLISLDKTLAEYFPKLAGRIEYADKITLRMMVKHRSGIPNYSDVPNYPWGNPITDNWKALELILDKPADFEPDSDYSYSNTNYLLIGEIMDKVLGYSHHKYIDKEILEPLNLTHTFHNQNQINIDDLTSGYFIGYDKDIKYTNFTNPGGSMIATIQDVGRFMRALNTGKLFTEEENKIYASIYEYDHTGLLPGYESIARYHKDIDAVVVLFVNTNGGYAWELASVFYSRIVDIVRERG